MLGFCATAAAATNIFSKCGNTGQLVTQGAVGVSVPSTPGRPPSCCRATALKQSRATTWRHSSKSRSAIQGRRIGGSWWIPKTSTFDISQENLPKCSLKNAKIDGIDMFNLKGVENRIYIRIFFSSTTCRRLKIFHCKSSKILLWNDWKVNKYTYSCKSMKRESPGGL